MYVKEIRKFTLKIRNKETYIKNKEVYKFDLDKELGIHIKI